ncbi:MAG: molybdopterin-dependent oxidoreductase, partial [Boseongicola sp.]|nr:molybdopterin-dependent oxidoreductase [Boseongicola sp.]
FGIGYSLLEKTIYRQDGSLLTDNVSSYKIPSIDDMPRDWTIEILQETAGPPGRRGLHNSKGVAASENRLGETMTNISESVEARRSHMRSSRRR